MKNEQGSLDIFTYRGDNLQKLPADEILQTLERNSFVRITGLFDKKEITPIVNNIKSNFDCSKDVKHDPLDTKAVQNNMQKLSIGGVGGDINIYNDRAKFVRILYNPIFADDIYGMREVFIRLAKVRNLLYQLPEDFAIHGIDNGLWTASRIHQYPKGGGFMVAHRDKFTEIAVKQSGIDTYKQVILLMSKKGKDYNSGGAFIEYDGTRLYYEDECKIGDVMIYDGRAIHGVGDIDPLEPLDLVNFTGRIVAFVTLFRKLSQDTNEYKNLAMQSKEL